MDEDDSAPSTSSLRLLAAALHKTVGPLDHRRLAKCFECLFARPAAGPLWERFLVAYLVASSTQPPQQPSRRTTGRSIMFATMTSALIPADSGIELLDEYWEFD